MANRIVIGGANLIGGASYVQVQIQSYDDGVLISDKYVSFNANDFECIYDNQSPNSVVMHFGIHHTVNISNADYSEFYYIGVQKTSPVDLATTVVADIAGYTV